MDTVHNRRQATSLEAQLRTVEVFRQQVDLAEQGGADGWEGEQAIEDPVSVVCHAVRQSGAVAVGIYCFRVVFEIQEDVDDFPAHACGLEIMESLNWYVGYGSVGRCFIGSGKGLISNVSAERIQQGMLRLAQCRSTVYQLRTIGRNSGQLKNQLGGTDAMLTMRLAMAAQLP